MRLIDLLAQLRKLNIKLWVEGERLRYSAPSDTLTPELKANLVEKKAEIIQFLRQNAAQKGETSPDLQPIKKLARPPKIPLSFAQQRLWFLEQLNPNTSTYNMPGVLQLQGKLDCASLENSLNQIVKRHEICRTVFTVEDGNPIQVIIPELSITLRKIDLTNLSTSEHTSQIQQLIQEEASQPFDLTKAPLLRSLLLQLTPSDNILSLVIHHIIFDAWSMDVLIRELTALYSAFKGQKPSSLPELPLQYADFAIWQRQTLSEERLASVIAYWKRQLGDPLPVLQLPSDYPHPPVPSFQGRRYAFHLSVSLTEKLKTLSQKQGVTLFMLLLAAYLTLLYRYTGETDLLVGTAIAGRTHPNLASLFGCFVNTLVLRNNLSGNPSFVTLLERVKQVALESYNYQDVPFEQLVEALQPHRNLSHSPLFQVGFAFYPEPREELILQGLRVTPLNFDSSTSKLDLTLSLRPNGKELQGWIEYSLDLFTEATIIRLLGHWEILLEGITANPQQSLDKLPLLTPREEEQLLWEWNQTVRDYPQQRCIHQQFERQARETPEAIALEFERQTLTYAQLNQKANQLAHYLQKQGVAPEVKVGIYLKRSPLMLIALLGVFKAGGAYIPLDSAYPQERLGFMLADGDVSLVLTQDGLDASLEMVMNLAQQKYPLSHPQVLCLDSSLESLAQESQDNPDCQVKPTHLAYILYTSGSTGQPKGVEVEHRGLLNLAIAQSQAFHVNQESRVLQFASFNFDASVSEIFMTWVAGGTLCLVKSETLLVGDTLIRCLEELEITVVTLPPSVLAVLPTTQLPHLKSLILAGETPSLDVVKRWSSNRELFNAYGPTEATVCATIGKWDPNQLPHRLSIGRPIANTQVYILDRHLQPVPVGITGEMYLGGVGIARCYHKKEDLTTQTFIPHPFAESSSKKLYKTGDLARYLPDGQIEFLGRRDRQVKIRGFRLEIREIEAMLNQHPQVLTGVVELIVEGEEKSLVAYVVSPGLETSDIRAYLRQYLPAYMIPSQFIKLDSLPLTANGKIDRGALPSPSITQSSADILQPRDNLELELLNIWENVLRHRPISITDNFFEIGGHSLLAVRLMALIEERLGSILPLSTLFQEGSIENLATIIRSAPQSRPWSPLVRIKTGQSQLPFFCVHPIGGNVLGYVDLARYLAPEQPFYGLQAPGLEEGQSPYQNIPDLAAYYLDVVGQVLPKETPYCLGGQSFGGLVAFEIAQQIQQRGQTVALLVIMDTPAPLNGLTDEKIDDAMWLVKRAEVLERFFGKSLGVSWDELKKLDPQAQFNYFLQKMRLANLIPPDAGELLIYRLLALQKASHQALLNYIPQVYDGKITLLRASEMVAKDRGGVFAESFTKPALGWRELTTHPIEIYDVPGNHITMLTPPHVRTLAQILQSCLSTVLSSTDNLQ